MLFHVKWSLRLEGRAEVAAGLQLLRGFPLWAAHTPPALHLIKIHDGKLFKPYGGTNKQSPV